LVAPHKYHIICVGKIKLPALFVQGTGLVFLSNVPEESELVLEK
jgi:hypothetical protein